VRERLAACPDEAVLKQTLRHIRQREMLRIAWRDLAGWAELEEHIARLGGFVSRTVTLPEKYNPRWIALKLLEHDTEVDKKIRVLKRGEDVLEEAEKDTAHLRAVFGEYQASTIF